MDTNDKFINIDTFDESREQILEVIISCIKVSFFVY